MPFTQCAHGEHYRAPNQSKIPGVGGDRKPAQHRSQDAVEGRGGDSLEQRLTGALRAHSIHDIETLTPARDHLAHHLRWIL